VSAHCTKCLNCVEMARFGAFYAQFLWKFVDSSVHATELREPRLRDTVLRCPVFHRTVWFLG